MTVRCKNTYGDGRIEYVEYVVAEPVIEDEDAREADYIAALKELGVSE